MRAQKVFTSFTLSMLLIVLSACSSGDRPVLIPGETDGVYFISSNRGSVNLAASWAFYPGEFVSPDTDPAQADRFEFFPTSWEKYSEPYESNSFGSYAIRLKGLDPSTHYAFIFPGYSSAVKYFVDGEEIYACGIPGRNAAEEHPGWDKVFIPVRGAGSTEITLVMHLSNFSISIQPPVSLFLLDLSKIWHPGGLPRDSL